MNELKKAARICFSSPEGRAVMEFLMRTYYDCNMDDEHLQRDVGRRDVVLMLKRLIGDEK